MDFLANYSDDEEDEQQVSEEGMSPAVAESGGVFVEREIALTEEEQRQLSMNDDDDIDNGENHEKVEDSESSDDDDFGPQPLPKPASASETHTHKQTHTHRESDTHTHTDTHTDSEPLSAHDRIDQVAQQRGIPISSEVSLRGHDKAVVSLSLEPAGNRVVTGSLDYHAKIYDFGGMDSRHKAFASVEVEDGHPLLAVSHSPSGDRFLVATTSCQPKIYDRDGQEIIKFVRGDMYLRDLSHTKGHTMEVTAAQWHPSNKHECLTSSLDGSLRVWDLTGEATFGMLINKHVLKVKPLAGAHSQAHARLSVTTCCYNADGTKVLAGVSNGSIQIWTHKRTFSPRPDATLFDASLCADVAVRALAVSADNATLAARYENGNVLLWDLKSIQTHTSSAAKFTPFKVLRNLSNVYPMANVTFSPDSSLLVLCSSPTRTAAANKTGHSNSNSNDNESQEQQEEGENGDVSLKSRLHFFEVDARVPAELSERLSLSVASGGASAICVKWQAVTNQILVSLSTGDVKVFYDATLSKKGALLSARKAPKREKDPTDFAVIGEILNPDALPMYRQDNQKQQSFKRVMMLKDPIQAKIPQKPASKGPGKRENTSFFFTNYVMSSGHAVDNTRAEDPREALLKMDALAKKDPMFLGRAYKNSQPQTMLASKTFEQEQEEFRKKQKTSHA